MCPTAALEPFAATNDSNDGRRLLIISCSSRESINKTTMAVVIIVKEDTVVHWRYALSLASCSCSAVGDKGRDTARDRAAAIAARGKRSQASIHQPRVLVGRLSVLLRLITGKGNYLTRLVN